MLSEHDDVVCGHERATVALPQLESGSGSASIMSTDTLNTRKTLRNASCRRRGVTGQTAEAQRSTATIAGILRKHRGKPAHYRISRHDIIPKHIKVVPDGAQPRLPRTAVEPLPGCRLICGSAAGPVAKQPTDNLQQQAYAHTNQFRGVHSQLGAGRPGRGTKTRRQSVSSTAIVPIPTLSSNVLPPINNFESNVLDAERWERTDVANGENWTGSPGAVS